METGDLNAVLAVLREHDRFVVTSHENPDGDAIGSLLALHLALGALGKDSLMVMGGTAPIPDEYGFLGARGARAPARGAGRPRRARARRRRLRPGVADRRGDPPRAARS